MNKTLNIINGDACINIMKEAYIEGDFLPWKDFLHEGSVPKGLTLEELSIIRANFISEYGLGEFSEIYKNFKERDNQLKNYKSYQRVVLWFEHDLYDQLQLLQLLDWFATQELNNIELTLIYTNNYLGESSPQQIKKMLHYAIKVTPKHFKLAQEAWSAFRESTPKKWFKLLKKSTSILPFLQPTILRLLEEFPNTKNGLSRTEYQALLVISNGIYDAHDIFEKSQSFEERKFMGEVIFWKILNNFENYNIIKRDIHKKLTITPLGKELLDGKHFWFNIMPLDRYIGGCHLSLENLWCWDVPNKTIKQYYFSKVLNDFLIVK